MIKIENTEVFNLEGAIRGMRNPLKSWRKSDSQDCLDKNYSELCDGCYYMGQDEDGEEVCSKKNGSKFCVLGANDIDLAERLIRAGSADRKFLQHIIVSCTITAPAYYFTEFDTYRVTPAHPNSTSTMHTLVRDSISEKTIQFSLKDEFKEEWESYLKFMNKLKKKYKDTKELKYFLGMKEMLAGGFYYTKDCVLNYENLRNMYHQRKNHRLPEWKDFCRWIEELPYSDFITK